MTDNPLFLIPIVTGTVFIITGILMMKFPPKKINSLYGYRTPRSMKDTDRWKFAQKYSGKVLAGYGVLLCGLSVIGIFFEPHESLGVAIGIAGIILAAILVIATVESALKKKFGSD